MRYILTILFCLLLFSCQHALEKPENLLSRKEMAAILTDIYLYKQTSNNMPLSKDTAFDTYVSIFIEHNTTKEIFQDSYNYYYAEANAMQHIYDDVTDNLKDKLTEEQLQVLEEEEEEERLEEEEKKNAETPE